MKSKVEISVIKNLNWAFLDWGILQTKIIRSIILSRFQTFIGTFIIRMKSPTLLTESSLTGDPLQKSFRG